MRKDAREVVYKILYAIAAILIFAFVVASGVDVYKYNTGGYIGSAPLWLYILLRAIQFVLPSIIVFLIAFIFKKYFRKK